MYIYVCMYPGISPVATETPDCIRDCRIPPHYCSPRLSPPLLIRARCGVLILVAAAICH